MKVNGNIQLTGDYGNPSGSGLAKLNVGDMIVEAYTDVQTKLNSFFAAIVAAQLTGCTKGDVSCTFISESASTPPAANINIDRKLVGTWRTTSDSTRRRYNISGVPAASTGISMEAAGERINATGKAALAAALEGVYGLGAGDVIVLTGKVLQKA